MDFCLKSLGLFQSGRLDLPITVGRRPALKQLPWIYPSGIRQTPEQAKRTSKYSHFTASLQKASENLPFSEDTHAVLAGSANVALSCSKWALFSHFLKRFILRDMQVVMKLKETKLWFGSAITDVTRIKYSSFEQSSLGSGATPCRKENGHTRQKTEEILNHWFGSLYEGAREDCKD